VQLLTGGLQVQAQRVSQLGNAGIRVQVAPRIPVFTGTATALRNIVFTCPWACRREVESGATVQGVAEFSFRLAITSPAGLASALRIPWGPDLSCVGCDSDLPDENSIGGATRATSIGFG
jgi:hypothetical protein